MRGTVAGLASPYSFGRLMPAIYQQDDFAMRWMSAFDELLAPVVLVLDNTEHYLDPALAPGDFLAWLATWVGIDELDETWPEQSRRDLVAHAVELYAVRGTVAGLKRHIAIYTGAEPEIEEGGGCSWSSSPGAALPGSSSAHLVVRVQLPTPLPVEAKRLELIVAASKPAHLPHRVELLDAPEELPPSPGPRPPATGPSAATGLPAGPPAPELGSQGSERPAGSPAPELDEGAQVRGGVAEDGRDLL